ncbi:HD domain-containing protein [Mycobacterium sp. Aquia_216]|uniref:HD domain-containing protein n=1 Tax=Mycobacterium sp. Aquia_216 TaxID=2991729 RepID=UPI00227C91C3|nr:HD domain-containing protein [Mycobacterium sp. Aquia_216]WAJ46707.1 HD domain-containing protein [Mycobacterium sp. Aquia_216]
MQAVSTLPDTSVAKAAIRLAQSTESPPVFNHSVRSYLFGQLIAAQEGMRPSADYDAEALFLGCVLHDLGAGSAAPGKERFEVEGADLAAALLTEHGCERALVDGVWEAIALHTSMGIADRRGALCHLVRSGVGVDFGRNAEFIDDEIATAIHARYPRLSMARRLLDAIAAQAQRNPDAAPPYTFPYQVLRERQTDGVTLLELAASQGRWGD